VKKNSSCTNPVCPPSSKKNKQDLSQANTIFYKNKKMTSKKQNQDMFLLRRLLAVAKPDPRLRLLIRDISELLEAGSLTQQSTVDFAKLVDRIQQRRWRCKACGSAKPPWIGHDGYAVCDECHADIEGNRGFVDKLPEEKRAG